MIEKVGTNPVYNTEKTSRIVAEHIPPLKYESDSVALNSKPKKSFFARHKILTTLAVIATACAAVAMAPRAGFALRNLSGEKGLSKFISSTSDDGLKTIATKLQCVPEFSQACEKMSGANIKRMLASIPQESQELAKDFISGNWKYLGKHSLFTPKSTYSAYRQTKDIGQFLKFVKGELTDATLHAPIIELSEGIVKNDRCFLPATLRKAMLNNPAEECLLAKSDLLLNTANKPSGYLVQTVNKVS